MNFRKLLVLPVMIFALQFTAHASASSSFNPSVQVANVATPPGNKERMIAQMKWFAGLSIKDYEKLSGKKLSFFERISFKLNQRRVRQMLRHNDWDEPTVLQKISWCFKGIILGPIALLLGYIFLRDEERELLKWIWFGFAGWCVIVAILLLSLS